MKNSTTSKFGNKFTEYTAATPFIVNENGTGIYKVLVVFHSRVGRVVYDRFTIVK